VTAPRLSLTASLIKPSVFADLAGRIASQRRKGAHLIGLHLGDSCRTPPSDARFARVEAGPCDDDLYRYGDTTGIAPLRAAFAERLDANGHGPAHVDPDKHVLVACGATHALFCALRAVLDPGDEVLVVAPYWPLAVGVIRAAGAAPVEVPLTNRLYADPSLDIEAVLAEACTARTRALYFATPNNPDGVVFSRAAMQAFARFALARDMWVVADEVYADYVYDGEHVSMARLEGMRDRTITAYSLSKTCALAGARIGFAVAPETVIAAARRVAVHTVFNVPVAAQRVALAGLRASRAWVDDAREAYRAARDVTVDALRTAGVDVATPQGGSFAFPDFQRVLGGRPLLGLLERAIDRGVLVAPGDGFGADFGSFGRVCFTAVGMPELTDGLARLRAAIDDFR
jgi:aspartate/methionine/tyrosine aminotransferase